MPTILVVTDILDGEIRPSNHEVFTAAAQIGRQTGWPVAALMLGAPGLDARAEAPGRYGVPKAVLVEDARLDPYSPDVAAAAVAQVAKAQDAALVLMTATFTGKDLMPRVAQLLDAGLAQDCTGFRVAGGQVVFTRPLYAGKVFADVKVTSTPALATLRPKAVKPAEQATPVEIERAQVDLPAPKVVVAGVQRRATNRPDVTEADVIVSGGRGMGGRDNWRILEDLADALDAATACSRPVSDEGWRPHEEHVGQTGKTVSPDLYVACGISGAIQHLAGVSSSKYIVAINTDPEAPIFKAADYGIVGDVNEVLPAMTEAVKKIKAGG